MLLSVLLEQLILDLIRQAQVACWLGCRGFLLGRVLRVMGVALTTTSDVKVLVVRTGTERSVGDGIGVFALGREESW